MKKCSYSMLVRGSWIECSIRATYYEIDVEDKTTRYPLCDEHAEKSPYVVVPITDWEYGKNG